MATVLRVYVRTFIVKAFGWDDVWMVLALLSHIMFAGCAIGGVHWGTGRHMDILTKKEIFMAMRVSAYYTGDKRQKRKVSIDKSTVLVALLHCLLLDYDCSKDQYRSVPATSDCHWDS